MNLSDERNSSQVRVLTNTSTPVCSIQFVSFLLC